MNQILYYPYINIPRTDWSLRTLLYYDQIGSIVPQQYINERGNRYEPFMSDLVNAELVIPINPINVLDKPWEVMRPFIEYMNRERNRERNNVKLSRRGQYSLIHEDKLGGERIHAEKFDREVFYSLEQIGLARRDRDDWYIVERRTANKLMKFLATIIGAKLNMLPTTDQINDWSLYKKTIPQQKKRDKILSSLIPFPTEINLPKLKKFKKKHSKLLVEFKNRVEQIVFDRSLIEGTDLYNLKLEELLIQKEELTTKMNESHFMDILFITVLGTIGAFESLTAVETTDAIIRGLPGFASAVYAALRIEKAENVSNQGGMKYLALMDKRIRNKNLLQHGFTIMNPPHFPTFS